LEVVAGPKVEDQIYFPSEDLLVVPEKRKMTLISGFSIGLIFLRIKGVCVRQKRESHL